MSDTLNFLICVLYRDRLLKCALQVKRAMLGEDVDEIDWHDPENWPRLHALLPLHVRECGPIIDVDTSLFEIAIIRD